MATMLHNGHTHCMHLYLGHAHVQLRSKAPHRFSWAAAVRQRPSKLACMTLKLLSTAETLECYARPSEQAQQSIQVIHGLRSGHSNARHTTSARLALLRSSRNVGTASCGRWPCTIQLSSTSCM